MPAYPNTTLWSNTYHVQIQTVDPTAPADQHNVRPVVTAMQEKSHVFDPNLQKQFLSEYDMKYKLKLQEWSKLIADKQSLMTIICGQCNNATRTEIALGANYKTNCENGELINFLTILQIVCYGSNNGGLSFKLYKNVVVVKSLNNFSNAKPNDPHGFKEELKIKYNAVLAVVGKFASGTGPMLELLKVEAPPLDWDDYYTMDVADQEIWEAKGDASNKAMLLLMNSKNDAAKKDLRRLYS